MNTRYGNLLEKYEQVQEQLEAKRKKKNEIKQQLQSLKSEKMDTTEESGSMEALVWK
jgi:chromosome segregation ATPase